MTKGGVMIGSTVIARNSRLPGIAVRSDEQREGEAQQRR